MKSKGTRRMLFFSFLFAALFLLGFVAQAPAVDFPTKSIVMLCGSSAGSPVDVMGRQLARHMEKILGKPVVVQNKPGGSQAEELSSLLSQPANGYTLGTVTTSTVGALAGHLRNQFKVDDFNFLALVQSDPYALVVKADSPIKDLKGLIEYAKANPGKVKVGGFGTGSGHHMAFLDLQEKTGIEMKWVSFDGGSAAIAAALGGHINIAHTNPGPVMGHVKAGRLRILAVAAEKRLESLPNVPTYRDQGVNLVLFQWRGVATKAAVPKPIAEKLITTIDQTKKLPEFKKYMQNTNQFDIDISGDTCQKFVEKEFQQTQERLKSLGLLK